MDSLDVWNDRPSTPLSESEIRSFDAIVARSTVTRHRRALSRFVAHLTPTTCRWLCDLSVPRQMWRSPC
ncbi:hypothetical protein ACQEU5_15255 [Marinactinospora thermotolerans]|uniref:Uncharacterized protein n=1 Tax=Marinactinospora thermotolerans DSM 45154 TaxID=1122192 RepID=A0A1T4RKE7_9ACTN|nr:hypothetical protein [Marinactinospora thermotolerans]SKA16443.1 hypothetical protein SAMN02745673_02765 [Marinactinospora thermotolerans DSM 45154]